MPQFKVKIARFEEFLIEADSWTDAYVTAEEGYAGTPDTKVLEVKWVHD